jgi:TonB family protein
MKSNTNARWFTALSSCLLIAMTSFFAAPSWGQSGAGPDTVKQTDKETTAVKPEQAEHNLTKRVAAVYPPLAKQVRIQGKVKVQVVISKTGTVESVNVVSGHPLLVQAAINAVKQWQYKPFLADGQPVAASTEVEVPFTLGISDASYQAEQKSNDDYFKREDECRNLLKAQKYAEAEASCKLAVELAEKLPSERQNERRTANELSGEALLYEKNFAEALSFFKTELAIGEASLKPTEAELGYAYHHVALGYHATGDPQKAQSYYEKAESTLRAAREHMDGDFFKNQYAKAIQSVLRDYIVLLQETGQEDAAAKAKQRADVIAREIHPVKAP